MSNDRLKINLLAVLLIFASFFVFLIFIFNYTRFIFVFGSDDGKMFHDLHMLFSRNILPTTSTFYVSLLFIFSKFTGITKIEQLNLFILILNSLSLLISSFFIVKIIKNLTKNDFVSLLKFPFSF